MNPNSVFRVARLLEQPGQLEGAVALCSKIQEDLPRSLIIAVQRREDPERSCFVLFQRDMMLMAYRAAEVDPGRIPLVLNAGSQMGLLPWKWNGRKMDTVQKLHTFLLDEVARGWDGETPPVPVILRLFAAEDREMMTLEGKNTFVTDAPFEHAMDYLYAFLHSWLTALVELHGLNTPGSIKQVNAMLEVMQAFVQKQRMRVEEAKARYEPPATLLMRFTKSLSNRLFQAILRPEDFDEYGEIVKAPAGETQPEDDAAPPGKEQP